MLTADELRRILHYDLLTGKWTWINPHPQSKMRCGDEAGRITSHGRRQIRINSGFYYSARLAYLYMTGEWPKSQMDHINRIKNDDRWENLRPATQRQNSCNRAWAERSGDLRGIRKHGNKFRVDIGSTYLGLHDTLERATTIRDQALHEFYGQFSTSERTLT